MDIKNYIKIAILIFLFAGVLIITAMLFSGCMSAPNRKDFDNTECWLAMECMYLNQKNIDKSICALLVDDCKQANRELRQSKK